MDRMEHPPDDLTRLGTKAKFDADLARERLSATSQSPLSLVYLHLDGLKNLNDTKGHSHGSEALMRVSGQLKDIVAGKGSAYRWGGDEFCILLPNHSLVEARGVGERCRSAIETELESLDAVVTSSVGVASCPECTSDPSDLVNLADSAMYNSKALGGNRVTAAETVATTRIPRPIFTNILLPYVSTHAGWNAGIVITNTSLTAQPRFLGSTEPTGGLIFAFFPVAGTRFTLKTDVITGGVGAIGSGLDQNGHLQTGGTFMITPAELLAAAGQPSTETFVGHVLILANFKNAQATSTLVSPTGAITGSSCIVGRSHR